MNSSRSAFRQVASCALALVLLVSLGCGSNKSSNPSVTDEKLIQNTVDAWISYLETGEQPGLSDMYDPAAWNDSPTKAQWAELAGRHPVASDISISVSGTTASATFTVTRQDSQQFHVAWTLHKVSGVWMINGETWT